MGCGCEQRRSWLLDNSPEFLHPAITSFDGWDFLWNVLAGVGTVVVLFFLLKEKPSLNAG